MPGRVARAALLLAVVSIGGAAGAGPGSLAGSLDRLADVLIERARPSLLHAPALDVGVAVTAPWPRLASDLSHLLASRLRGLGARSVVEGGGDAAWARANGLERVLRVGVEASGNTLRAGGSVIALAGGLWSDESETREH